MIDLDCQFLLLFVFVFILYLICVEEALKFFWNKNVMPIKQVEVVLSDINYNQ